MCVKLGSFIALERAQVLLTSSYTSIAWISGCDMFGHAFYFLFHGNQPCGSKVMVERVSIFGTNLACCWYMLG